MKKAVFLLLGLCTAAAPVYGAAAENPLKIRASAVLGYDDNPLLDAQRKGDLFGQESVALSFKKRLSKKWRARIFYDVLNVNYFEETDQNFLYQNAGPGLDYLLDPKTVLQLDYEWSHVFFPKNTDSTSDAHELRAGFIRKIGERWRLKGGFSALVRQFDTNKLREGGGELSIDDERRDLRYAVDGEVGFAATDQASIRLGTTIYHSDSNDFFHDFYDFDSYTIYTGLVYQLTPRLYSSTKLSYQRLVYGSRTLIDDAALFEKAHVYTFIEALYYDLNKNTSVGLSYSYRQKNSNEPSQKYSGTIVTLGLYYSF